MWLPDYIIHNGEGGRIVTSTIAYIVLRPITEPVLLVSSPAAACLKQGSTRVTTLSVGLTANKERSDSPKALHALYYKTCLERKEGSKKVRLKREKRMNHSPSSQTLTLSCFILYF